MECEQVFPEAESVSGLGQYDEGMEMREERSEWGAGFSGGECDLGVWVFGAQRGNGGCRED
jgi:hypothetical protein